MYKYVLFTSIKLDDINIRMKKLMLIVTMFLLTFSLNINAKWIEYSTTENGDTHFFDNERVKKKIILSVYGIELDTILQLWGHGVIRV